MRPAAQAVWHQTRAIDAIRAGAQLGDRHIPHNFDANTVVYPGIHDNNTSQGWWLEGSDAERQHVRDYLGLTPHDELEIHWQLITAACASVADTAIHPMQDVLGLDGRSRMNLPRVGEGYWEWLFSWDQVKPVHAQRLVRLGGCMGGKTPGLLLSQQRSPNRKIDPLSWAKPCPTPSSTTPSSTPPTTARSGTGSWTPTASPLSKFWNPAGEQSS